MSGDFRASLIEQAEAKREEFVHLEAERQRIEHEMERLKKYIDNLNPLLVHEGLPSINLRPGGGSGFAAPGNRSENMPDRRPGLDGVPLARAVLNMLAVGRQMHADEMLEHIYDVKTPIQRKHAKQSLVGALGGMLKKGSIERPGPNIYQLPTAAANGQRSLGEGVLIGQ